MKTIPEIGAVVVHLTIVADDRGFRRLTRIDVSACGLSLRSPSAKHGPRIHGEPGAIRVDRYAYVLHPKSPMGRTDVVRLRTWTAQQLIERVRLWGFVVFEFALEPGYEPLLRAAGCIPDEARR